MNPERKRNEIRAEHYWPNSNGNDRGSFLAMAGSVSTWMDFFSLEGNVKRWVSFEIESPEKLVYHNEVVKDCNNILIN